ncbi:ribosomal protein L7/L12 [Glycomyces sp. TRM65418]|uniref:ribosomal protein L7/L12 n=1 Tax=Glycomyces sp. TRM65418 TaxID=2867006 RepID=UPI001CE5EDF7|nr:ribosomal protein L7/L12 [Glycomyces sp. TRM65418]MCC3764559.1 ribosomal protein L7/L12 [Glycomyces sp. TRM65418]QZD54226.1 ribosomal protein L7/L12 [Glycomyces sp. TRM65418]
MDRDPVVTIAALTLILVVGSVAVAVAARRADRRAAGTGTTSPPPVGAGPVREGPWTLTLESVGPKLIPVVRELRAITGLGLAEAKGLTDRVPSTVLAGVDHAAATAARDRLAAAGAAVRIAQG